jgi:nucleotide-binding universal stress UspA family protein
MPVITNILFPVDFSASCVAMAPYVKRAATLTGATVSLIHVYDPASYNGFEIYVRPIREIEEEHQVVARSKLKLFLEDEFPVAEYPRILTSGEAATEIAAAAKDKFDLIIMPTHAGRFRRMLLGSTTAKVLNDADCPVMTSRHAEAIAPRPLNHREWLCSIGLDADSERVLRFTAMAASQIRANFSVVHAIQAHDPDLPVQLDLEEQFHSAAREEARARISELQRKVGSNVPVHIGVGSVKSALLEAVRRFDADALVIGRSPQPGSHGRLRDLTYAIVRDSPFPVISL